MQFMTPRAVQSYADMVDYESHILMRSFYSEGCHGTVPVNPQYVSVRYTLK